MISNPPDAGYCAAQPISFMEIAIPTILVILGLSIILYRQIAYFRK